MQELKCGGKHITGPNHHSPVLGERQNAIKRWCLCLFAVSSQATASNIYQDKQISHSLDLSGINTVRLQCV